MKRRSNPTTPTKRNRTASSAVSPAAKTLVSRALNKSPGRQVHQQPLYMPRDSLLDDDPARTLTEEELQAVLSRQSWKKHLRPSVVNPSLDDGDPNDESINDISKRKTKRTKSGKASDVQLPPVPMSPVTSVEQEEIERPETPVRSRSKKQVHDDDDEDKAENENIESNMNRTLQEIASPQKKSGRASLLAFKNKAGPVRHSESEESENDMMRRPNPRKSSRKTGNETAYKDMFKDMTMDSDRSAGVESEADSPFMVEKRRRPKKSTREPDPSMNLNLRFDETRLPSNNSESDDSSGSDHVELVRRKMKSKKSVFDTVNVPVLIEEEKEQQASEGSEDEEEILPKRRDLRSRKTINKLDFELPPMTPEKQPKETKLPQDSPWKNTGTQESDEEFTPIETRRSLRSFQAAKSPLSMQLPPENTGGHLMELLESPEVESPLQLRRLTAHRSSRNLDADMTPVAQPDMEFSVNVSNQYSLRTSMANGSPRRSVADVDGQILGESIKIADSGSDMSISSQSQNTPAVNSPADSTGDDDMRRKKAKPTRHTIQSSEVILPSYVSPAKKSLVAEHVGESSFRQHSPRRNTATFSNKNLSGDKNVAEAVSEDKSDSEEEDDIFKRRPVKPRKSRFENMVLPSYESPAKVVNSRVSMARNEASDEDLTLRKRTTAGKSSETSNELHLPRYSSPSKTARSSSSTVRENSEDEPIEVRKTTNNKRNTKSSTEISLPAEMSPGRLNRKENVSDVDESGAESDASGGSIELRRNRKSLKKSTATSVDLQLPNYSSPSKNTKSSSRKSGADDSEDEPIEVRKTASNKRNTKSSTEISLPAEMSPGRPNRKEKISDKDKSDAESDTSDGYIELRRKGPYKKSTAASVDVQLPSYASPSKTTRSSSKNNRADDSEEVSIQERKTAGSGKKTKRSSEIKLPSEMSLEQQSGTESDTSDGFMDLRRNKGPTRKSRASSVQLQLPSFSSPSNSTRGVAQKIPAEDSEEEPIEERNILHHKKSTKSTEMNIQLESQDPLQNEGETFLELSPSRIESLSPDDTMNLRRKNVATIEDVLSSNDALKLPRPSRNTTGDVEEKQMMARKISSKKSTIQIADLILPSQMSPSHSNVREPDNQNSAQSLEILQRKTHRGGSNFGTMNVSPSNSPRRSSANSPLSDRMEEETDSEKESFTRQRSQKKTQRDVNDEIVLPLLESPAKNAGEKKKSDQTVAEVGRKSKNGKSITFKSPERLIMNPDEGLVSEEEGQEGKSQRSEVGKRRLSRKSTNIPQELSDDERSGRQDRSSASFALQVSESDASHSDLFRKQKRHTRSTGNFSMQLDIMSPEKSSPSKNVENRLPSIDASKNSQRTSQSSRHSSDIDSQATTHVSESQEIPDSLETQSQEVQLTPKRASGLAAASPGKISNHPSPAKKSASVSKMLFRSSAVSSSPSHSPQRHTRQTFAEFGKTGEDSTAPSATNKRAAKSTGPILKFTAARSPVRVTDAGGKKKASANNLRAIHSILDDSEEDLDYEDDSFAVHSSLKSGKQQISTKSIRDMSISDAPDEDSIGVSKSATEELTEFPDNADSEDSSLESSDVYKRSKTVNKNRSSTASDDMAQLVLSFASEKSGAKSKKSSSKPNTPQFKVPSKSSVISDRVESLGELKRKQRTISATISKDVTADSEGISLNHDNLDSMLQKYRMFKPSEDEDLISEIFGPAKSSTKESSGQSEASFNPRISSSSTAVKKTSKLGKVSKAQSPSSRVTARESAERGDNSITSGVSEAATTTQTQFTNDGGADSADSSPEASDVYTRSPRSKAKSTPKLPIPTRESVKRNLQTSLTDDHQPDVASKKSLQWRSSTPAMNEVTMTLDEVKEIVEFMENNIDEEEEEEDVPDKERIFTALDFHTTLKNIASTKKTSRTAKIFTIAELANEMNAVRSPSMIGNTSTRGKNRPKMFSVRDFERACDKLKNKALPRIASASESVTANIEDDQEDFVSASDKEDSGSVIIPLTKSGLEAQGNSPSDKDNSDRTLHESSISQTQDTHEDDKTVQDDDHTDEEKEDSSQYEKPEDGGPFMTSDDSNAEEDDNVTRELSSQEGQPPNASSQSSLSKNATQSQQADVGPGGEATESDGEDITSIVERRKSQAALSVANKRSIGQKRNSLITSFFPTSAASTSTQSVQQSARRSILNDSNPPQPKRQRGNAADVSGVSPMRDQDAFRALLENMGAFNAQVKKRAEEADRVKADRLFKAKLKENQLKKAQLQLVKARKPKKAPTAYAGVNIFKELKTPWINKKLVAKLQNHFRGEPPKALNDFLRKLCADVKAITMSRAKNPNAKIVEDLMRRFHRRGVCEDFHGFHVFAHDYLPGSFIDKVFAQYKFKKEYYNFDEVSD